MRDNVLQEVLSPGRHIDVSRPARQLTLSGLPEQRRTPKRQISQHSDFALQDEWKDCLGRVAVGDRIVHLDEIERVIAHDVHDLCVLAHAGRGYADVTNLSSLLPLLHQGNQRRHAIEIVDLQELDARGLQPLERSLEAVGARRGGRAAGGTTHELGRDKHFVARAQALQRLTNEGFAVAIGGGRVDDRTAELAHALELGADLLAHPIPKGVGAYPDRRNPLSARGYGFGDRWQRGARRLGGWQPAREQVSDARDYASFEEIAAGNIGIHTVMVAGRVSFNDSACTRSTPPWVWVQFQSSLRTS